jgi:acetyltransferase-like isoleucine patch superfamily enzyme
MDQQPIIIIGSAGHAKVIIDIIEKMKVYQIIGLTNAKPIPNETVLSYPVLGTDDDLLNIYNQEAILNFCIAVGDNWTRQKVKEKLLHNFPNAVFPCIIHPSAQIGRDVLIGQGTVIMAGAIINTGSKIGDFVILNTKCSIDHDNTIGDFVSAGPNSTTGGDVAIGSFSVLGLSATIKRGISVGNNCVVGSSAYLHESCEDNLVLFGIPAKAIRSRVLGEKYL